MTTRAEFEQWHLREYGPVIETITEPVYSAQDMSRVAWAAWQAGLAAQVKVSIPTNTMEQEYATHYRRGYAAGLAARGEPVAWIRRMYQVLGPNVPKCISETCDGCAYEWGEALRELREHAPREVAEVDAAIARRKAAHDAAPTTEGSGS